MGLWGPIFQPPLSESLPPPWDTNKGSWRKTVQLCGQPCSHPYSQPVSLSSIRHLGYAPYTHTAPSGAPGSRSLCQELGQPTAQGCGCPPCSGLCWPDTPEVSSDL